MNLRDMIIALCIAGAIAASIRHFIAPATENPQTQAEATVAVEQTAPQSQTVEKAAAPEMRRSAVLTRKNDGHYWARTVVNNRSSIEFLVDTGASVIALTYNDAQKLGLRPDQLDYIWQINTAGGQTMGASVLIDSVKVGQVHIRNVEAMVLRTDLEHSLLGMSFLSKLHSYEFRGERMIIRQ